MALFIVTAVNTSNLPKTTQFLLNAVVYISLKAGELRVPSRNSDPNPELTCHTASLFIK
jgi:hypothetical protein